MVVTIGRVWFAALGCFLLYRGIRDIASPVQRFARMADRYPEYVRHYRIDAFWVRVMGIFETFTGIVALVAAVRL